MFLHSENQTQTSKPSWVHCLLTVVDFAVLIFSFFEDKNKMQSSSSDISFFCFIGRCYEWVGGFLFCIPCLFLFFIFSLFSREIVLYDFVCVCVCVCVQMDDAYDRISQGTSSFTISFSHTHTDTRSRKQTHTHTHTHSPLLKVLQAHPNACMEVYGKKTTMMQYFRGYKCQ